MNEVLKSSNQTRRWKISLSSGPSGIHMGGVIGAICCIVVEKISPANRVVSWVIPWITWHSARISSRLLLICLPGSSLMLNCLYYLKVWTSVQFLNRSIFTSWSLIKTVFSSSQITWILFFCWEWTFNCYRWSGCQYWLCSFQTKIRLHSSCQPWYAARCIYHYRRECNYDRCFPDTSWWFSP